MPLHRALVVRQQGRGSPPKTAAGRNHGTDERQGWQHQPQADDGQAERGGSGKETWTEKRLL